MPGIKYDTGTTPANAIRMQNFLLTYNAGGPTSETGYYSQYPRPTNGWVIYINKASQGPSIYACEDDNALVSAAAQISQTPISSVAEAINYFNNESDKLLVGTPPPNVVTDGLVMYIDAGLTSSYPRTGATINDLSGENNDGTLVNSPTFSNTNSGMLNFNGTDQLVTFSSPTNIPVGNSNYTISVWFRADVVGVDRGFLGWGNYGTQNEVNAIRLATFGFRHYWWANDLDATVTLNANTWYNVVARFDGTTRDIWLNNSQIASDTPTGHNVPNANNLTFARTNVSPNFEYFDGDLSNILIYNTAISNSQITDNWNALRGRYGL